MLLLVLLLMHLAHQRYELEVAKIIQFGFMLMELNLTNLRYSKMVHQLTEVYMAPELELKAILEW